MKAKRQFETMHDDCIAIVRGIKIKNDLINKKHGVESENKLLLEIQKDKLFFESELTRLKNLMKKMEENYLDPDSVRKLDMVRKQAKKQTTRNEQLIKQLIKTSFEQIQAQEDQAKQYGNTINYSPSSVNSTAKITTFNPYHQQRHHQNHYEHENQIVIEGDPIENYELQNSINQEKAKVLMQVQRDFMNLNGIINQTAEMVHQQGENLDIITEDLIKANKNIQIANSQIIQAGEYQKKAKKKYVVFALLIILICLLVGIPVIMLS